MNTDEERLGLSKEEHNQLQSGMHDALPESCLFCGGIPVLIKPLNYFKRRESRKTQTFV